MQFVYVLKKAHKPYIGYTDNLRVRFKQHRRIDKQAELIYYEAYLFEEDARKRERKLKQYGSAWRALRKRINFNNA